MLLTGKKEKKKKNNFSICTESWVCVECFGVSLYGKIERRQPCSQHQLRAPGCCGASPSHTMGAQPLWGPGTPSLPVTCNLDISDGHTNIGGIVISSSFSSLGGIEVLMEHSVPAEEIRRVGGRSMLAVTPMYLMLFPYWQCHMGPIQVLSLEGLWLWWESFLDVGVINRISWKTLLQIYLQTVECCFVFCFFLDKTQGSFF